MGEAYSNLELPLKETGHLDSAVQVHKNAMELSRTDGGTLTNYGSALQAAAKDQIRDRDLRTRTYCRPQQHGRQNRPGDRADGLIRKSIARLTFSKGNSDGDALGVELPEHALANKNLGLSLLLVGKYEAGIRHYA